MTSLLNRMQLIHWKSSHPLYFLFLFFLTQLVLHGSNKVVQVLEQHERVNDDRIFNLAWTITRTLNIHTKLRWQSDCNSSNAAVIISRGVVGYAGVTSFSSSEFWVRLPTATDKTLHLSSFSLFELCFPCFVSHFCTFIMSENT